MHHVAARRLPYPNYFANLIVSDASVASGELPSAPAEALRLLRPYGGVAMFGGGRIGLNESVGWEGAAAAAGATLRAAAAG